MKLNLSSLKVFNTNPKFLWGEHCKTYQKNLEFKGNTTFVEKRFDVKRVFWKALDQELERCNGTNDARIDASKCMTQFVEEESECRSNLMKSDPKLPICDRKENISAVLDMAVKFWEADENSVYGYGISKLEFLGFRLNHRFFSHHCLHCQTASRFCTLFCPKKIEFHPVPAPPTKF